MGHQNPDDPLDSKDSASANPSDKHRLSTRRTPLGFSAATARSTNNLIDRVSVLKKTLGPAAMSAESHHNAPADMQKSGAPASYPYQMTGASHDPQNSAVGNSVVRDLMRVYESLTQSSTPQVTTDESENPASAPPVYENAVPAYPPHAQPGQPGVPPSYTIPPRYQIPGQYPPSQQQHQQPEVQPRYYADSAYSQQPYMVAPGEHPPQHGYPVHGHEQPEHQHHPPDPEENEEVEEPQEMSGRSRRKRRGSDDSAVASNRVQKGRKKNKSTDGRWSKRFTWPEDLHRDFVSAIFDVGLKHSSPSTILEHMPKHEQITTERIKSHLQKYRLHRVKSKKEFVSSYEASLRNFQNRGTNNSKSMSGGEVAAQLTYTNMNENAKGTAPVSKSVADTTKSLDDVQKEGGAEQASIRRQSTEALMLPQLTEAEKSSPIGAAMGYLMGLFFSLKQQLMIQRAMELAEAKNRSGAPVQDVYNSFVSGNAPSSTNPEGGDSHQQIADEVALKPASQSVRTNIEENSIMKREMQSQMALQTKMRALKEQELNKYKNAGIQPSHEKAIGGQISNRVHTVEEKIEESPVSRGQRAGEPGGNDGSANEQHPRGLSIGASEEFWNTDVVDEQLFEFLMNN